MKALLLVLGLCWLGEGVSRGDDQVRRIQEALRKRNLYFGEVDGRKTEETTGAIRRYQQRQGLPATGEMTEPTLFSLGVGRSDHQLEWPEGPLLKSDLARALPENERLHLEAIAIASPEPPPIAEPPLPEAPSSHPAPEPAEAEETAAPVAFVRSYLAACATNQLKDEMSFYAPRVSYFDHGTVNGDFIARDVERFYKRWPNRHYDLLDCQVARTKEDEWETRFRIAFRYAHGKVQQACGKSLNIFTIKQDDHGMHFTSMREQLLRD